MPQRRLARGFQLAGRLQLGGILLFIARFELGVPPGCALALLEGVLSGRFLEGPRELVVVSTVVRRRRVEPRQQRRLGERGQLVVGAGGIGAAAPKGELIDSCAGTRSGDGDAI